MRSQHLPFKISAFAIFLILIFSVKIVFAQSGWVFQNPVNFTNYSDYAVIDTLNCYISGDRQTILKTTDAGTSWQLKNLGINNNEQYNNKIKLNFININEGFAYNGALFHTSTGGETWNLVSNQALNIFSFVSPIVGYSVFTGETTKLKKTTNGGVNWFDVLSSSANISELKFLNDSTGIILTDSARTTLFKTTNSGQTFVPVLNEGYYFLLSLTFINNTTGYIYKGFTIHKTTDQGSSWFVTLQSSYRIDNIFAFGKIVNYTFTYNTGNNTYLGSITSTNSGMNWGPFCYTPLNTKLFFVNNISYQIGNNGLIYKSNDYWGSYSNVSSNFNIFENLIKVQMFYSNKVYTFSGNDKIMYSDNGGINWNKITVGTNQYQLVDGNFINSSTGYAASANNIILKTTDSGMNWLEISAFTELSPHIYNLKFLNENTGYAYISYTSTPGTGYAYKKTTNGGLTWTNLLTGYSFFFGSSGSSTTYNNSEFLATGNLGYSIKEVYTYNRPNDSYSHSVMLSNNGGTSWNSTYISATNWVKSISFINDSTGYFSSSIGIHKTTNQGTNWNLISPFYATKLKFLNDTLGYASNDSNLYYTTNGGLNWTLTLRQVALNDFTFNEFQSGYAVGNGGLICKIGSGLIQITNISSNIPGEYKLSQNYPNPFNPSTKINFDLKNTAFAMLRIYDMTGREVRTLVNEKLSAGSYSYDFKASELPSGVYFYQLQAEGFIETKKMILLK